MAKKPVASHYQRFVFLLVPLVLVLVSLFPPFPGNLLFADGARSDIEAFLAGFEEYVTEWENLGKKSSITADEMARLQQKAQTEDLEGKAQAAVSSTEWTVEDQLRMKDLGERMNQAVLTVSQKIMASYQ
ncbi:MAG: hypothetical protein LBJ31_08270 [Treponema sp.]|jgi:hypothetical protein|nr:hypothetical protein [Treponema sp.]